MKLIIIQITLLTSIIHSQIDSISIIDNKLFQLLEQAEEDAGENSFFDFIEEYTRNPIDINKATLEDLLKIPFLNPLDAKLIIKKRKSISYYSSIEEIKNIGIDNNTILLLKPFIKIILPEKKNVQKNLINKYSFRSRLKSDLQNRVGFTNGNYRGNRISYYNRLKFNVDNLNVGILTEKDQGELNLIDHYTGYVQYSTKGIIKNLLVGDYTIEFGQGLALWSPYSFSKGTDVVGSPTKKGRDISPHLSAEENRHFRGLALSLDIISTDLKAFYSNNNISATLKNNEIVNYYRTGYYRTLSEINKKENVTERVLGLTYSFNLTENIKFGILHYRVGYDKNFNLKSYYKRANETFNFSSLHFNFLFDKINISSELATNDEVISGIANIHLRLNKHVYLLASIRNYSDLYFNIFSNGFGEFGNTKNEIGYYLGLKVKSYYGIFNIYYDIFKTHSKSFYSDFPANGSDLLLNHSINISKALLISSKYKIEKKEKQILADDIEIFTYETKTNYRLELKYRLSKDLYGKSRVEYVEFFRNNIKERGLLSFQEIKFNYSKIFKFTCRIVMFDTDSYQSRLYEFENDLRGVMSNLPLFGEGFRWYILASYRPYKFATFSIKYAETIKPNETSIGSGNSKILDNLDNRISLQIDCIF